MSKFRQLAFMARCRPQRADARTIATKHRIVFVGYCPWTVPPEERDPHNIRSGAIDLSEAESGWKEKLSKPGHSKKVAEHRNRAHEIDVGSMVIVPRVEEGVAYVAPVAERFQLINDPPWLDEYLRLRREQELDTAPTHSHAGDVAQIWRTEDFRSVPFPLIPAWVSRSLFGQSQIARLRHEHPETGETPLEVLRALYRGEYEVELSRPTDDVADVRRRLQRWLTPVTFEQFVCNVLQAAQPSRKWWHVGGSGDGGADGIGLGPTGDVEAALQCKFKPNRKPASVGRDLKDNIQRVWGSDAEAFVATLFQEPDLPHPEPAVTHLGPTELAHMVLDYRDQLPAARRIGIAKA